MCIVFYNLEKRDAQKKDQQTEKQTQTEENDSERLRVNTVKGMETSKLEEQKTKPENKLLDNGGCLCHIYSLSGYI